MSPLPDRNTCKLPFCSNLKSWGGGSTAGHWTFNCHQMSLSGGFQLPAVEPSTATRCHYQYQAEEAVILIGKLANCHSPQSSNRQSNPPNGTLLNLLFFSSMMIYIYEVYQYVRPLCSIDQGGSSPSYIYVYKQCSGMQGLVIDWPGGFISFLYIYIYKCNCMQGLYAWLTRGVHQNRVHFSKTIDLRGHMPRCAVRMNIFPSISLVTP